MTDRQFAKQRPLRPCDVLVVEDERIQCEELAGFLQDAGLDVEMAFDARSALHQAATHRPRVALIDYNLPDATGVDLAAQLRALLPETAIIMMSGRIDGLSEQVLEQLGISVFVNKPLPLAPLQNAVVRLARSRPNPAEQHHQRCWFSAGIGSTH